jgi:alanyl-tRNA synthetase
LAGWIKAGQIVKLLAPMVGGAGGGRPDFAEAGGKDPSKIDEMLAAVPAVLAKLLS